MSVPYSLARRVGKSIATMAILCLGHCLVSAQKAPARKTSNPSETHLIEERFVGTLQLLSRRGKVCFVVEGTPLTVMSLPADLPATTDFRTEVERIASMYDYDTRRKGDVFIFTKRYSDPADYPDVSPAEYRLSLFAASRVLEAFDPKYPP